MPLCAERANTIGQIVVMGFREIDWISSDNSQTGEHDPQYDFGSHCFAIFRIGARPPRTFGSQYNRDGSSAERLI